MFFDLDQYVIRADQQSTIVNDAHFLNNHPDVRVLIEGHCDELGSTDYNLALGDIRANEVKEALVKAGIDAARIDTPTAKSGRSVTSRMKIAGNKTGAPTLSPSSSTNPLWLLIRLIFPSS